MRCQMRTRPLPAEGGRDDKAAAAVVKTSWASRPTTSSPLALRYEERLPLPQPISIAREQWLVAATAAISAESFSTSCVFLCILADLEDDLTTPIKAESESSSSSSAGWRCSARYSCSASKCAKDGGGSPQRVGNRPMWSRPSSAKLSFSR